MSLAYQLMLVKQEGQFTYVFPYWHSDLTFSCLLVRLYFIYSSKFVSAKESAAEILI